MTILIYDDYKHSHTLLARSLRRLNARVEFCDARDILNGCLDNNVSLFIMPGGADLYYAEKLNGAGNAAIRRYVEQGGAYLGICAGAYYACAALEWAKGTRDEISGARELALCPGTAIGPVKAYCDDNGSWNGAATMSWDGGQTRVLYNGGPTFTDTNNAKILARYADLPDQPAAIIECAVGAGRAILCSPHIELNEQDRSDRLYAAHNKSYTHDAAVNAALRGHDNDIWPWLITRALTQRIEKAA